MKTEEFPAIYVSYVKVPHDTINDEYVTLVRHLFAPNSYVKAGDAVAEVETSKSIIEVHAPVAGFFRPLTQMGEKIMVGASVAEISAEAHQSIEASPPETSSTEVTIFTEPARLLALENSLDLSIFNHLPLVKTSDVQEYLEAKTLYAQVSEPNIAQGHRLAIVGVGAPKTKVLVLGAGGHAKVIADILLAHPAIQFLGFVASRPGDIGKPIIGKFAVISSEGELEKSFPPDEVALFVAIGDNESRLGVADRYAALGYKFVNAIAPSAVISKHALLGAGVAVMAQAVVGVNTRVSDHTIINTGASIDHDGAVGRGAHLAPGSRIGGGVQIEVGALIGIGCSVNRNIKIGAGAVISSGFSIYRDVAPGSNISAKLGRTWW